MTKDELLAALVVERQDQTWWRAPEPVPDTAEEIARRRLEAEAWAEDDEKGGVDAAHDD